MKKGSSSMQEGIKQRRKSILALKGKLVWDDDLSRMRRSG